MFRCVRLSAVALVLVSFRPAPAAPPLPDLIIREVQVFGNTAVVRVANIGPAPSVPCVLRMTVQDAPLGPLVAGPFLVNVPALAPGAGVWVPVNTSIPLLPGRFLRLRIDVTNTNVEVIEFNNAYTKAT